MSLKDKYLINRQKNCEIEWLKTKEKDILYSGTVIIQLSDVLEVVEELKEKIMKECKTQFDCQFYEECKGCFEPCGKTKWFNMVDDVFGKEEGEKP